MSSHLDFYFDFSSPYGYFASTRINDLARQYGRRVDWHPFAGEAFKPSHSGTSLAQNPIKKAYITRDYVRSAQFHQIPFKIPSVFPLETRMAARAVMWTESQFGEDKGIAFAQAIFKAYYVEDKNIGDPQVLLDLGQSLGLEPTELSAGMNNSFTKEQIRAETDLATAKGVFGSPFILLDGEPFWGFDRLDQLEAALKAKAEQA
ncbi:MAG: 2-hydroxychromene-2-carboxylate isomerase [Formosimonas sp.]